jgi:hypothetical protein
MARTDQIDPARTRVLAERWGNWILPHWLERQVDPTSPAFSPSTSSGGVHNVTVVDCVPVGVLDGSVLATVDPRGLVTPSSTAWSLDWWIGADDRWHVPAREPAVRQRLVDAAPVVETAMRVPGGDMVQRVWAANDSAAGEVVVVELENASRLPVAVALSLRPYGIHGAGRLDEVSVLDDRVLVDGRVALWLPKAAARVALSDLAAGDVAGTVLDGSAGAGAPEPVRCGAGLATAALVYPLAHTATLRVCIPVGSGRDLLPPTATPPHDAVARGWALHVSTGARVELPDGEMSEALAAARAQLLLAASGRELAGEASTIETSAIVGALDRLGAPDPAAAIIATLPSGQGSGGRLGGADPDSAATSAALVAAGRHWRTTRDDRLVDEIAGPLAAGGHHHRRARGLSWRGRPEPDSLLDLGWRLRGLLDAAEALRPTQPDAASALDSLAVDVRASFEEALAAVGPADSGATTALALVAPLDVLAADSPFVDRTLHWLRDRAVHEGGVAQLRGATGLSPVLTSMVGRVELRRGEGVALDRLDWFLRTGGPTRTWSDLVHPRLGTGCGGEGGSPAATAAFVELLLDLLVHESATGDGLVLCAVWPEAWLGAGVEVHGVGTTLGLVSFAVRWHGDRPALLWELEPHPGCGPVTLTIPGLDPAWSTTEPRGDALLAPPEAAEPAGGAAPSVPAAAPPAASEPGSAESSGVDGPGAESPPSEGQSFA